MSTSTEPPLAPGALARAELGAHLEPIVDLRSGRCVAVEVLVRPRRHPSLVRWRRSVGGGRHLELPLLALEAAAQALDRFPKLEVHANITAVDLEHPVVLAAVRSSLPVGGHERLVLEVTEELPLRRAGSAGTAVAELRALGVRFALDDFGEGWSNFAAVQLLRPELIKVTAAVVGPHHEPDLAAVVVRLAERLGARTVFERIEDDATLEWARSAGFDLGQGWRWPAIGALGARSGIPATPLSP